MILINVGNVIINVYQVLGSNYKINNNKVSKTYYPFYLKK